MHFNDTDGMTPGWLASAGAPHHIRTVRADDAQVQALVRARYGWRGLRLSGPGCADLTLAACDGARVVATLGVALDGPAGLAADTTFPEEVAGLRRRYRLCEFTRLASDSQQPAGRLLAALWHTAWVAAHRQHAADLVLMEVHPRHARFYRLQFGCRDVAPERLHHEVQAPAVLLAADAGALHQRLRSMAGSSRRHSVCARAFSAEEEDRVLERLQRQAAVPKARGAARGEAAARRNLRPAAGAGWWSLLGTSASLALPR